MATYEIVAAAGSGEPACITTAQHPTSGETYAVKVVDGVITEAAGPLNYRECDDPGFDPADALSNATTAERQDDGKWLQAEIDKATS
jgi:hypothetical protein